MPSASISRTCRTRQARRPVRTCLEKIIQVPFRISALGDTKSRISLSLVGAEPGDNNPAFNALIVVGRAGLRLGESRARPW